MPVKAPFRFARINRWIYEPPWADLVSHDVPFADGLSGEAEVEITARSSILVGGDRRKATQEVVGEVQPFKLPDGGYAIPGSALQGMARAILEVAGFGRLGPWVEDRKFGIRDLSATPTARVHYRSHLPSQTGWLIKSANDAPPRIFPCKYARIRLDKILVLKGIKHNEQDPDKGVLEKKSDAKERYEWFINAHPDGKGALNAKFTIHQQSGTCRPDQNQGVYGTLVLTGKPQDGIGRGHKKLEFVFYEPDRTKVANSTQPQLPVSCDVWKEFQLLHEKQPGREINPNWAFWKDEFNRDQPVPVFYWQKDGQVTALGTAFAFKAAYRKSARDLLGHSNPGHLDPVKCMKLDLAHLIFGVAAEHGGGRGLKRRARFGLARAVGDPRPCNPQHPLPQNPSILLGPKPSYVGLYVRQRPDNKPLPSGESLATYTPLDPPTEPHLHRPELSGVKLWPARGATQFNPGGVPHDLADNCKVQTRLVTLPPGTVFRSRLTFHNLRPVELGALLWALSFGDSAAFGDNADDIAKRHRLGMGKPLGLGEVAIRVTNLKTEATCSAKGGSDSQTAMELVKGFVQHMEKATPDSWYDSKQVRALLKAATPNATQDLEYMILEAYQKAKNDQEYLPDYVCGKEILQSGSSAPATSDHPETPGVRWVDDELNQIVQRRSNYNEQQALREALRGKPLAEAWQRLEDPEQKQDALKTIEMRWGDNDWSWNDPPQGRAMREAWNIYHQKSEPE